MIDAEMPYAVYRAHPNLGSTDLKNILKTPAHFLAARENQETTRAKDMGRAIHSYMLERDTFFSFYAVEPEGLVHKGKNPWKKEWEQFKADNADKIIVDRDTWDAIKGIQRSIRADRDARKIFETCRPEVSIIGENGTKARADLMSDDLIVDLKSCEDASDEGFIWSIQKFQYYLQSSAYVDVAEESDGRRREFLWIACEKLPPYGLQIVRATEEMQELGKMEYLAALEIHRRCSETGVWPGYKKGIRELSFRKGFRGVLR